MNTVPQSLRITDTLRQVVRSNGWQYWFLQILGWTGYAVFILLENWVEHTLYTDYVLFTVCAAVLGLMLTMTMRESFRLIWNYAPVTRGLLSLLALGIATGLWSAWKLNVTLAIAAEMEIKQLLHEYMYWYSYSFCILLSWTGLYYGIKYYKLVQAEHERALRSEAMAHQAQLKMLRYQLNPHFLFNTLNSISTLVLDHQGEVANRMIAQLSRFLRYSLDNDPMQKVPLNKELEAMRLYLDIEQIRFSERLRLEYSIEDAAQSACIPSLLLQPLIENAIKYAVAISETGGTIHIDARVAGSELSLVISDDGPGLPVNTKQPVTLNGVGLANIRERLRTLYGERQSCQLTNLQPHGLRAEIHIPYEIQEQPGQWKN